MCQTEKDWCPGSKLQVLDLGHPSLYCIVYDRTHAYLLGKSPDPVTMNLLPVVVPAFDHTANVVSVLLVVRSDVRGVAEAAHG
jgi:hypothetical protein